jgi:hypothetical protein
MIGQIISIFMGIDILFFITSMPSATGYILDKFNI